MPHGMNKGNNNGYTPLNFDFGIRPQPTIGQQRRGVGTKDAKSINNPLRPSQPEGVPTAYAGDTFDNTAEINKSLDQEKKARAAALANTEGNYDHSSGSFEGQVWKVPNSLNGGGNRDNERTNANGVVQKGTDMSRSFNDMLMTVNKGQFSGTQLPTTNGNPFEGRAPKTDSFNAAAPGVTGNSYDNYGAAGGVAAASSTDKSQFTPMTGSEGRIQGGTDRPESGSLAAALADKEGINSYMSKFSSGDRERAANRAFLDTEGSMEALRAKEAVNGVVYAQQNHYIAGADPKGPAQKITRDEARSISSGETNAQALLKSYTNGITEAGKESPAERQDPVTAFNTDSGITASDPVSQASAMDSKDFALNNSDGGTFGAPKGYNSKSSYKDPAFPNPFAR